MPWPTPDPYPAVAGWDQCLRIPDNYAPMVYGALLSLTKPWNWEAWGSDTVEDATAAMIAMLDGWGEACMPVGAIIAAATATTPAGYLACDGGTYAKADYPRLYDALDSAYISDATHFTTPDLRGRAVIGSGSGAGLSVRAIDDSGGEETHTLITSEMPAHSHTYLPPTINPDVEGPGVPDVGATVIGTVTNTSSAGGDGAHENMPPFRALHYFIKAD